MDTPGQVDDTWWIQILWTEVSLMSQDFLLLCLWEDFFLHVAKIHKLAKHQKCSEINFSQKQSALLLSSDGPKDVTTFSQTCVKVV